MVVTRTGRFGEAYKGVLTPNIFSKGNQALVLSGVESRIGDIIIVTRDAIAVEMGVIELADKTKVPGGRTNAGEFTMTVQLANDRLRGMFQNWYQSGINRPSRTATEFKKDGHITYFRHNTDATAVYGGSAADLDIYLKGMFCSKLEYPDFDLAGGDEGDADSMLTVTVQYDWAGHQESNN